MEFRQLRYFIAVAEEGNIGAAARRLHISQPPITRQIQALEQDLGVVLFERTHRGVELTAAGTTFLEDARRQLHVSEISRRSEEHTSELQSLMLKSYAVFCLKKNIYTIINCTKKMYKYHDNC